jgi:hypothetical protein
MDFDINKSTSNSILIQKSSRFIDDIEQRVRVVSGKFFFPLFFIVTAVRG